MKRMHLGWALLCVGCGGDSFSADEREATSDGGRIEAGGKPKVQMTSGGSAGSSSDDAGGAGASSGGSSSVDDASTPGAGGSSGAAVEDAGPDVVEGGAGGFDSGSAGGSGGGPSLCTTGEIRCSGTQPEVCAGDAWFASGDACAGAFPVCLEGRCVECDSGTQACYSATQPGICDSNGMWVPNGSACAFDVPRCLDNECMGCNPDDVRTADYCPDCGAGGIKCCKATFGVGCGCFTLNGCQ